MDCYSYYHSLEELLNFKLGTSNSIRLQHGHCYGTDHWIIETDIVDNITNYISQFDLDTGYVQLNKLNKTSYELRRTPRIDTLHGNEYNTDQLDLLLERFSTQYCSYAMKLWYNTGRKTHPSLNCLRFEHHRYDYSHALHDSLYEHHHWQQYDNIDIFNNEQFYKAFMEYSHKVIDSVDDKNRMILLNELICNASCVRSINYSEPISIIRYAKQTPSDAMANYLEKLVPENADGDRQINISPEDIVKELNKKTEQKHSLLGYADFADNAEKCNRVSLCQKTIEQSLENNYVLPNNVDISYTDSKMIEYMYSFTRNKSCSLVKSNPLFVAVLAHEIAHCLLGHDKAVDNQNTSEINEQYEQNAQSISSLFLMDKYWSYYIAYCSLNQPYEYRGAPLYGIGDNTEYTIDLF